MNTRACQQTNQYPDLLPIRCQRSISLISRYLAILKVMPDNVWTYLSDYRQFFAGFLEIVSLTSKLRGEYVDKTENSGTSCPFNR